MAPRLSGQTSIFGGVFFVFESLLGIEKQKKLKKFTILTRKPRNHVRILIYRTWPIATRQNMTLKEENSSGLGRENVYEISIGLVFTALQAR